MSTDFEVAVIGSGPVGAATAALLARHGGVVADRIALIAPELAADAPAAARRAASPALAGSDAAPGPGSVAAPPDLRVAAISRASERVLANAGAWSRLSQARLCAYQGMRVWHESVPADGPEVLAFTAAELGEPNLGHIVETRALAAASLAAFAEQGGKLLGARLTGLRSDAQAARLQTDAGEISARLVVGADGARSLVREFLGIPLRMHDYRQSAIVATVATARPHQSIAWQRFLGSGPLALLPLFNGCCSIVWSAERELAAELMALPPADFARRLDSASDRVLGATRLESERLTLPLQRATATALVANRAALVGDAAHLIHPLAGQGVNLGFLDVAALCETVAAGVAEGEDPGAARLLTRYEQQRYAHDALMSWSMSGFNELLARRGGMAGWLAARLLGLAGASGVARRGFARQALGIAGGVPRLARSALREATC
jgi:2-polyprenylphenol 6-hydroxylase